MSFRSGVRDYYERNTGLFARFGSGPMAASVHRALWAPGVATQDAALSYVHTLVRRAVEATVGAQGRVLDLGCGLGGALRSLRTHGLAGVGVTLSPAQARTAARIAAPSAVLEADFHALPFARFADAAYAVEAFAHSDDPQAFFAEAARVTRSRARLVLIDDTLARPPADARENRLLARFQTGWHTPSILPLDALLAHAHGAGWQHLPELGRDLTPWLRLRTLGLAPSDWLSTALGAVGRVDLAAAASSGSVALQQLLAQGVIAYRMLVFENARARDVHA